MSGASSYLTQFAYGTVFWPVVALNNVQYAVGAGDTGVKAEPIYAAPLAAGYAGYMYYPQDSMVYTYLVIGAAQSAAMLVLGLYNAPGK